jgi:hypothetical protein
LVDKFTKATNLYLKQENGSDKQQPGQPIPIVSLQPNSKRPSETIPQELLQKPSAEQGTGRSSQSPSNPVSPTTRTVKQSSTGQRDLFSGNAGILEKKTKTEEVVEQQIEQINRKEQYKTGVDNTRAMENSAISSMVGRPETREALYRTI